VRRILIIFGVLVVGLGIALWLKLRQQELEKDAPSGGSGTVEGSEVDVVARLSARVRAIHAEEGDTVKQGQLLVELDCDEPEAVRREAAARVASSEATLRTAQAQWQAARFGARGAGESARAAEHLAASSRETARAARAAEEASAAQKGAVAAERDLADKARARVERLHRTAVGTEADLDTAAGRAAALSHQERAAAASIEAARRRAASAKGSAEAAAAQALAASSQARVARAQAETAERQLDVARHAAEAARAALRRAEIAVAECKLTAPRQGVVLTRSYEPGEVVLPGSRVLTLADLRTVKTTFFIPNANLGDAVPGREAVIVADAYPGEVFRGKILSVSAKAEFTPRNIQVREDRDRLVYAVKVEVPNPQGKLRPGMPVEVQIPGTRRAR
jgi:HlyD family secretion protein